MLWNDGTTFLVQDEDEGSSKVCCFNQISTDANYTCYVLDHIEIIEAKDFIPDMKSLADVSKVKSEIAHLKYDSCYTPRLFGDLLVWVAVNHLDGNDSTKYVNMATIVHKLEVGKQFLHRRSYLYTDSAGKLSLECWKGDDM